MDELFMPIDAITPETENWKARVCVQSKGAPQETRTGMKIQRLMLLDSQGETVGAVIFGIDIATFGNTLTEGLTYIVKNARVKDTPEYINSLATCSFQWILNHRTFVMPDEEHVVEPQPLNITITKSSEFYRHLDTHQPICTECVFIGRKEPRTLMIKDAQITKHEYDAINVEMQPFIVTFWGDALTPDVQQAIDNIEQRTTAVLLNFTVSSYHGISLNSNVQSQVLLETASGHVSRLNEWKHSNMTAIGEFLSFVDLFEKKIFQSPERPLSMKIAITVYDNAGELETAFFAREAEKLVDQKTARFFEEYDEDYDKVVGGLKARLRAFSFIMRVRSKIFKGKPDFTLDTFELVENDIASTPHTAKTNNTGNESVYIVAAAKAKKKLDFGTSEYCDGDLDAGGEIVDSDASTDSFEHTAFRKNTRIVLSDDDMDNQQTQPIKKRAAASALVPAREHPTLSSDDVEEETIVLADLITKKKGTPRKKTTRHLSKPRLDIGNESRDQNLKAAKKHKSSLQQASVVSTSPPIDPDAEKGSASGPADEVVAQRITTTTANTPSKNKGIKQKSSCVAGLEATSTTIQSPVKKIDASPEMGSPTTSRSGRVIKPKML